MDIFTAYNLYIEICLLTKASAQCHYHHADFSQTSYEFRSEAFKHWSLKGPSVSDGNWDVIEFNKLCHECVFI